MSRSGQPLPFGRLWVAVLGIATLFEESTPLTVTSFRPCVHETDPTIDIQQSGISISKCMEQCALRPWCQLIGYNNKALKCDIFKSSDFLDLLGDKRRSKTFDCVYIKRDVFEVTHAEVATQCSALCPSNLNEKKTCNADLTACTNTVPNGELSGNMLTEGSRQLLECDLNHGENAREIRECTTGQWQPDSTCTS